MIALNWWLLVLPILLSHWILVCMICESEQRMKDANTIALFALLRGMPGRDGVILYNTDVTLTSNSPADTLPYYLCEWSVTVAQTEHAWLNVTYIAWCVRTVILTLNFAEVNATLSLRAALGMKPVISFQHTSAGGRGNSVDFSCGILCERKLELFPLTWKKICCRGWAKRDVDLGDVCLTKETWCWRHSIGGSCASSN